uniref:Putative secreted protein n=1 Tax=Panstrongylus lignarius TaxID=156445 RepID=A0A224Y445_9HEMI
MFFTSILIQNVQLSFLLEFFFLFIVLFSKNFKLGGFAKGMNIYTLFMSFPSEQLHFCVVYRIASETDEIFTSIINIRYFSFSSVRIISH